MNFKHFSRIVVLMICCLSVLTGCGNAEPAVAADLSYTKKDVSSFSAAPHVKVVGLGEASHGVKQYQQMKAEVFKALVQNSGCRSFIIEGDFGGALKVDDYINGGGGSAEDAVGEIGFAIYRTREMADLADWMRTYNATVPEDKVLHFYGMDVQRYDNNKEYLFSVLDQADPSLSAKYQEVFAQLTDDNRNSLDKDTLRQAKEDALALLGQMDASQSQMAEKTGETAFDNARECARTIYACCDVMASSSYNMTRDRYMFEKVEWFLQHGDGSVLFINGHNGHIGKTSVAGYTCLGQLLSESLGDSYYCIGTDARETEFHSQNDNGGFDVVKVSNTNDLNGQLAHSDDNQYFVDFAVAVKEENWNRILNGKQRMTTLNVGLSGVERLFRAAYTTTVTPSAIFDGMIVFETVTPSTLTAYSSSNQ